MGGLSCVHGRMGEMALGAVLRERQGGRLGGGWFSGSRSALQRKVRGDVVACMVLGCAGEVIGVNLFRVVGCLCACVSVVLFGVVNEVFE